MRNEFSVMRAPGLLRMYAQLELPVRIPQKDLVGIARGNGATIAHITCCFVLVVNLEDIQVQ
jgi:hypothetical protein